MQAALHPINEHSEAMQDGRSQSPRLPDEFDPFLDTRAINSFLHSGYKVEEVLAFPRELRIKLIVLLNGINDG